MKIFLIAIGGIAFALIIYFLFFRKTKLPIIRGCIVCGAEPKYGYSEYAESIKNMEFMCRKCLVSQLEKDYTTFSERAVVIQPVPGPPCYVFHSNKEWGKFFKESRIADDARAYLLRMETICHDCGREANFLWIESSGLTKYNFGNVLAKGFSETLLARNPKPISLCGKCCVRHIAKELEQKGISYLEVCGPKGMEDGFVMPMAY